MVLDTIEAVEGRRPWNAKRGDEATVPWAKASTFLLGVAAISQISLESTEKSKMRGTKAFFTASRSN